MLTKQLLSVAVLGGALVMSAASANGANLLDDQFDDGALGTNTTGVGSGFTLHQGLGTAATATESAGVATLSNSGSVVTTIQSNDTFNPTDLTLTWSINSAVNGGFNGGGVGWVEQGGIPFLGAPAVELDFRADRLTFDLIDGAGNATRQVGIAHGSIADPNATYNWAFNSPLLAEVTLSATGWAINVSGTGVSVNQTGLYADLGIGGLQYGGATRVTLDMILAESGGALATYASSVNTAGGAEFEYVTLVPEPTSLALIGLGGMMVLRRRR